MRAIGGNCKIAVIIVERIEIMTSLKPTEANQLLRQFIRTIPFLENAKEEEFLYLCRHSSYADLRRFEIVYHKGEANKYVYFVCHGMIKISSHQNLGKEVIRTICHAGMIFGEGGLSGETNYTASAQSLDRKTTVIKIEVAALRKVMEQNTTVCLALFDEIGKRLRKNELRLESVIVEDARTRIINFLRENAEIYGNKVGFNELLLKHNYTQQDIADFTGTSRQTVTTILNDLKRQNIISMNRRRILIRDAALLGI